MKKASLFIPVALYCLLTACGQKTNTTADVAAPAPAADTAKKYTLAMVVNKKDPSCGMPLTAGLEDTVHYKDKAYGFCSKECKNEFLKNPEGYLAKMK
jgi:YHS domain-containing protein